MNDYLVRDFERLPETFRSLHFLAFAILMLQTFVTEVAMIFSCSNEVAPSSQNAFVF
jgi:hypothetical protein